VTLVLVLFVFSLALVLYGSFRAYQSILSEAEVAKESQVAPTAVGDRALRRRLSLTEDQLTRIIDVAVGTAVSSYSSDLEAAVLSTLEENRSEIDPCVRRALAEHLAPYLWSLERALRPTLASPLAEMPSSSGYAPLPVSLYPTEHLRLGDIVLSSSSMQFNMESDYETPSTTPSRN
jgi:hypothetical protein